ncbi:hypothetical protein SAY87_004631 [Trapa incisa]|uniref:Uncharacterized protein n=1 Tax=Trapa incisa TaxID=236973 RepID=A0AAN7JP78_9MYRT|nr:hypothetical protein SAY87_004631 [Trapa incisa]
MAGIASGIRPSSLIFTPMERFRGKRCCCSKSTRNNGDVNNYGGDRDTPQLLKVVVSGVTELLRVLSPINKRSVQGESFQQIDEISVSGFDDIMSILKSDYEKAYFVTGVFTPGIYTGDCIFEDPTIRFRGRDLYQRNLNLLVPFFDQPSIALEEIEKGEDAEYRFVLATWKLRTYLKLPWRPLITIKGSTVYELNNNFQIVRHAESWNVSALQAIGQIFIPSSGESS